MSGNPKTEWHSALVPDVIEYPTTYRRNTHMRQGATIALERCMPLLKAWAIRAPGYGASLEILMASCYMQGFTDARTPSPERATEAES